VEEMNTQLKGKNVSLILRSKVPKGTTTLPAVWQMKHKCQNQTREVYKWKACLNINRSRQVKGQDYWDTYMPVATWGSICLILAKAIIQGWHSSITGGSGVLADSVFRLPEKSSRTPTVYRVGKNSHINFQYSNLVLRRVFLYRVRFSNNIFVMFFLKYASVILIK